ncbi:hypothetical protein [Clostridium sp. Marseille-P2415]|uniref:hypothetical protein n=1 Tax=Clostridium sp. Marseille-P2415 TaxID=1805471 RepID=UPI0009887F6E|nr:hypothetical protein [Clostridium sp. Marseille-P2415]
MKKMKSIILVMLVLSIILLPAINANAAVKETQVQTKASSGSDYELEERKIRGGGTIIWDNSDEGYYLRRGSNITFQVNAEQDSDVVLEVYRKESKGVYTQVDEYTVSINEGGSTGVFFDILKSGRYAFGVRNLNSTYGRFSGWILLND